jgi:hypothetical protein
MRSFISISSHIALTLVVATLATATGQTVGRDSMEVPTSSPAINPTNKVSVQNDSPTTEFLTPYHGPVVKGVDTKTLTGKVMCGYQG